jgi:large subunit ribosomal protein L15
MKYDQLDITSKKSRTRVGRGIAAGKGKTAGRGTKGQNARKSGGVRPGFEGGQNPLMQRLPKLRGFRSIRPKAETVYTGQLNEIKGIVDNFSLAEAGIISSPYVKAKVVVNGEVNGKVTVKLQGASESAVKLIKKAGGQFDQIDRPSRSAKEKTKDTKK